VDMRSGERNEADRRRAYEQALTVQHWKRRGRELGQSPVSD